MMLLRWGTAAALVFVVTWLAIGSTLIRGSHMTIDVLYTHDASHPPTWRGRTIHPSLPHVTAEANDLDKCRRRVREGLEASGIRDAELVEYQGVLLGKPGVG